MKLEEKTIDKKTVYSGKIFDVEQRLAVLPDGRQGLYDIVKSSDACAIVALDDDENVLMVRQYRQSVQKIMYEIPAGKIDSEEDPKECAIRELKEETGYTAKTTEKIISVYMSPGFCTEMIHIYKATELELGDTDFDEDEFIETTKMPLTEVLKMIRSGEIDDAKTVIGILSVI